MGKIRKKDKRWVLYRTGKPTLVVTLEELDIMIQELQKHRKYIISSQYDKSDKE